MSQGGRRNRRAAGRQASAARDPLLYLGGIPPGQDSQGEGQPYQDYMLMETAYLRCALILQECGSSNQGMMELDWSQHTAALVLSALMEVFEVPGNAADWTVHRAAKVNPGDWAATSL